MILEGELLRKLRMIFGFKQHEMAKKSGVQAPYLSRAERNIQPLNEAQSAAIISALYLTEKDVEDIERKFADIIQSSDTAK